MASFSGEIEFEVVCERCGSGLSVREATSHTGKHTLHVDPCERCEDKVKETADTEGYDRGCEETLSDFKDKVRATIEVIDEEKRKNAEDGKVS